MEKLSLLRFSKARVKCALNWSATSESVIVGFAYHPPFRVFEKDAFHFLSRKLMSEVNRWDVPRSFSNEREAPCGVLVSCKSLQSDRVKNV